MSVDSESEMRVPFRLISPVRVWTMARHTFTQLVRMKVFYFLLIFAGLIFLATFWLGAITEQGLGMRYAERFSQQVGVIKNTALGTMQVFTYLFAIAGSAMLLPRDLEERTLYTILSKPVPRYEYILGKFFGMIMTIGVCLLIMAVLFMVAVYFRQGQVIAAETARVGNPIPPDYLPIMEAAHEKYGMNMNLAAAVWVLWLKGAVICALTILISTFTSSTLFTMIFSFALFVAGHFPSLIVGLVNRSLHPGPTWQMLIKFVRAVFPNFEIHNVFDGVVNGEIMSASLVGAISLHTLSYLVVYLLVACLIFWRKEL